MGRDRARPSRLARAVRSHALALLATVALLSILAANLNAGRRYFYCPDMQLSMLTSCCEHEAAGRAPEHASLRADDRDCCETRTFRSLAPVAFAPEGAVLAAPLLAVVLAPAASPSSVVTTPSSSPANPPRAGPPPARARARLQVFLC